MSYAFATKPGGQEVEIAGVGQLAANGKTTLLLDRASLVMPELADKNGKALGGQSLAAAARRYAESTGLVVVSTDTKKATVEKKGAAKVSRPASTTPADQTPADQTPDSQALPGTVTGGAAPTAKEA